MGNEQRDGRLRTSGTGLIAGVRAVIIAASLAAVPVSAAGNDVIVDRWFAALQAADAAVLGDLLSPNAVIKLNDIGTSQSKAEFLDSMTEWKSAIEDGTIRHKPDGEMDDASAYKVCYTFANNELLTREVFTMANGKIVSSEQTTLAESCAGF